MNAHDDSGPAVTRPGSGPYILPVGSFKGRTVTAGSAEPCYLLRTRGVFYTLNRLEYLLFAGAYECIPAEQLISSVGRIHGLTQELLRESLGELISHSVLLELSGNLSEDTPLVKNLRAIPRAVSMGYLGQHVGGFSLLTPDGTGILTMDFDLWALWTRIDGAIRLSDAVTEAANDTGKTQTYLWRSFCCFLPMLVRGGLVAIDG